MRTAELIVYSSHWSIIFIVKMSAIKLNIKGIHNLIHGLTFTNQFWCVHNNHTLLGLLPIQYYTLACDR